MFVSLATQAELDKTFFLNFKKRGALSDQIKGLKKELKGMKIKQLVERALQLDVPRAAIDEATGAASARKALGALIAKHSALSHQLLGKLRLGVGARASYLTVGSTNGAHWMSSSVLGLVGER